jgi:dual specificity tyrosine-phosphorylation-regulated kinase 2/3/4
MHKKDRPPALRSTWQGSSAAQDTCSDGEVAGETTQRQVTSIACECHLSLTSVQARSRPDALELDAEIELPRSASATSSLDPYYFGAGTPSESPIPSVSGAHLFLKTPEMQTAQEPVTPVRDPAAIDRRGLVGVGELATPRWVRGSRRDVVGAASISGQLVEVDEGDYNVKDEELFVDAQEKDSDLPDSPWTIEAIDGEQDESEEVGVNSQTALILIADAPQFLDIQPPPRSLLSRRSNAEESGGEEILYPRQSLPASSHRLDATTDQDALEDLSYAPPTAFLPPGQRPRKRTSDEFELDQAGMLLSKQASLSTSSKEKDKASARKHRSLGVGLPSSVSMPPRDKNAKERRRDTLSVNVRHSRQISASSSSSSHGDAHASHHSRRLQTSDYSHLPPSPGTSSIQQFLRHGSGGSTTASPMANSNKELPSQPNANVAHSLLRGTQEGWSDLDDQATVEALRKLDGISGRSARARSSIGGHSRVSSASRPSTPANPSGQWEGVEGRRSSRVMSTGNGSISGRDRSSKDHSAPHRQSVGLGLGLSLADASAEADVHEAVGKDDAPFQEMVTPDKPLKKHGSISKRGSFTPKRGSASSTNYTGTPTTSSRDSTSLSTTTSATSASALSSKSLSKARRNSASSDISSGHSADALSLRDRTAQAASTEAAEERRVPPVPPLPKDFSTLKAQNNIGVAFPVVSPEQTSEKTSSHAANNDTIRKSLEMPSVNTPSKHQSLKVTTPTHKAPSKKWSFSNPLGKKLVTSPSISSMKDPGSSKSQGTSLSPRALSFTSQLRKSTSREHPIAPRSARKKSDDWENINVEAMASASSLASMSSFGSTQVMSTPASVPPAMSPKTPDRLVPSRSETTSSASTNLTASMPPLPQNMPLSPSSSIRRGASTKRLTPSSIPFFRRSSSQSMQVPPTNVPPSSPTYSSTHSQLRSPSSTMSPTKESPSQPAVQGSHKKSSVLSLGLPSLLKGSSSRRSLHSDKEKSDNKSSKDEARQVRNSEKERQKKDEKERSESRISVLMGRKRGKVRV